MARAVSLLAEGKSVSVLANDDLLTTGKAAEILNVSRQYLVRLIDDGAVPAVKVNRHRRVRLSDLQAYKSERDSARNAALDRLAAMSEDMGGYALSR
jgi:excisionase family DNA binding protein